MQERGGQHGAPPTQTAVAPQEPFVQAVIVCKIISLSAEWQQPCLRETELRATEFIFAFYFFIRCHKFDDSF